MDTLKPDRELYMRKAEMMKRGKSEAKQGDQAY